MSTSISGLLSRVVQVGCACLTPAPTVCTVYHGAGGPLYSFCPDDSLVAWAEEVYWSTSFPAPAAGALGCDAFRAVRIAVRLRRHCWPVVNQRGLPPDNDTLPKALALAGDVDDLVCCLAADLTSMSSTILGSDPGPDSPVTPPVAVPDRNEGGRAGYTVRFTVGFA